MHHAYLVIGSREGALEFLDSLNVKTAGSPDFLVFNEETFGIEEARLLSQKAIEKAFIERKVILISPQKITTEAQNALLKTFEEPIADTHFFLCVREEASILPTLKSRCQVVHVGHTLSNKEAEKFMKMSVTERLKFAKDFEGNLSQFLDELLLLKKERPVYEMRLFASDRAASARLILEHLSLVI